MVKHKVLIIGGGFAGLCCARKLTHPDIEVTLIDKRNFHLFQPLLYQVATGGLSPANIAAPLRSLVRTQENVTVLLGEVTTFHTDRKTVDTTIGVLSYDTLVVAAGAAHSYFGHPEWEQYAPGLKTIEEATEIRSRILLAFEEAERTKDPEERSSLMTFVIIGGGPTGVELAGALSEIARHTFVDDFKEIFPEEARVLLIEHADRVLPFYPKSLTDKALGHLTSLGIRVMTGSKVTDIGPGGVTVDRNGASEFIKARTVLWAAGVQASPLARLIAEATGAASDRSGRVEVDRYLNIPGHPDIFVVGDMACFKQQSDKPLPGLAPVAMQQGRHVARIINNRFLKKASKPFRYTDRGSMATIGRGKAVAQIGEIRFSGYAAWLAWLFIHLMYLVQFQNRVLVLFQWSWNYWTWNRAARLITGDTPGEQATASQQS
ncbi:MAG: NADH dehydrogenase [Candidatus Hydrogenedentota bacterium]